MATKVGSRRGPPALACLPSLTLCLVHRDDVCLSLFLLVLVYIPDPEGRGQHPVLPSAHQVGAVQVTGSGLPTFPGLWLPGHNQGAEELTLDQQLLGCL